jgi:hypothetical protein
VIGDDRHDRLRAPPERLERRQDAAKVGVGVANGVERIGAAEAAVVLGLVRVVVPVDQQPRIELGQHVVGQGAVEVQILGSVRDAARGNGAESRGKLIFGAVRQHDCWVEDTVAGVLAHPWVAEEGRAGRTAADDHRPPARERHPVG